MGGLELKKIPIRFKTACCDILIGRGILPDLGKALHKLASGEKVAVVTDPTVDRIYGATIRKSLKASHVTPLTIRVPAGEKHKTLKQVERIYDSLIQHHFERGSTLISLGGGVVGDITGFVAATYLRGIPYIQCPTTVVAQVDASIGGKTGVDHKNGKNLIGAFYQPKMVYIDPETLRTLPEREFVAGLAEVVKYGVIMDSDFFSYLEDNVASILARDPETLFYCITKSAESKAGVVASDERESGLRRILNYGHTFGHAIETLTYYRRYQHGEAVSIGMAAAARLSHVLGILSEDEVERQDVLLKRLGLPTTLPKLASDSILAAMQQDKKVKQGATFFVLPEKIGSVRVEQIGKNVLRRFLKIVFGKG